MELDAVEFLRRFLQHVLPPRLTRVRYYGFLANRDRAANVAAACELIASRRSLRPRALSRTRDSVRSAARERCVASRQSILNATGPGSTPHDRHDPSRPRRSRIVTVASGRVRLPVENDRATAASEVSIVTSSGAPVSESDALVAIQALKALFATTLHQHPPGSDPYFPQEARGFVQLNSSPHPLHSLKHGPRPASPLRGQLESCVGGCRIESYELGVTTFQVA